MNMALKSGHDFASSWSDDAAFINTTDVTCFDRVLATEEHDSYFLDAEVAEIYRQTVSFPIQHSPIEGANCFSQAYESVGLPSVRRPPCEARNLRAVFLRRDRPFWNEEELMQAMRDLTPNIHIETISADVPYQVQVDMFAQADILVSVHGSHLTNQLFMRPGAGLVEVFPHWFYHPEQTTLARLTGVDHIKLTNNPLVPRELCTPTFIPFLNKVESQIQEHNITTGDECMQEFLCR